MTSDDESFVSELDEDFSEDVPFTSTTGNVVSVKYDPVSRSLFIGFHNGTYVYRDVDAMVVAGISGASSVTRYLNENVKGIYDYESV